MKATGSLILLLATVFMFSGCTELTPTDASGNKKVYLTAKPWKTISAKLNGNDVTSSAQTLTKYNTDGTYTATNPDGSTEDGKWEFNVDETNIIMDKGSVAEERNWEILVLTSSSLKLRSNDKINGQDALSEYTGEPD